MRGDSLEWLRRTGRSPSRYVIASTLSIRQCHDHEFSYDLMGVSLSKQVGQMKVDILANLYFSSSFIACTFIFTVDVLSSGFASSCLQVSLRSQLSYHNVT